MAGMEAIVPRPFARSGQSLSAPTASAEMEKLALKFTWRCRGPHTVSDDTGQLALPIRNLGAKSA